MASSSQLTRSLLTRATPPRALAPPAPSPLRLSALTPSRRRRPGAAYICARCLHASQAQQAKSRAPKSRDRGPPSKEDTQTDFAAMNVLGNTPPPATGIDATTDDGFAFSNNTRVSGCGVFLLGGSVYRWRPWLSASQSSSFSSSTSSSSSDTASTTTSSNTTTTRTEELQGTLRNAKNQFEPPPHNAPWGLLEVVHPKPDLLIIGTGPGVVPLSPVTRKVIASFGVRIEVMDTRNAASQYNLLATERGVGQVAAALVPMGWREVR